jgi:hypothetical protein
LSSLIAREIVVEVESFGTPPMTVAPRSSDCGGSAARQDTGCGREKPAMRTRFFRQHGEMLDVADYELVWPPELFAAEARRILARPRVDAQAIDLLLREAFRDDSAAEDAASPAPFDSRASGAAPRPAGQMLAELAKGAHGIRRFSAPRPYWPQRRGREAPGPYLDASGVRRGFADLIGNLSAADTLTSIPSAVR